MLTLIVLVGFQPLRSAAVDSTSALADLRMRLDALYSSAPYRSSKISAKVISLKTGAVLYQRDADQNLTPASTTKLFSTAGLYAKLGQGATLRTEVRTNGKVDAQGTLQGDLYLVGCGDALLTTSDIDALADDLDRLGIKRITGGVYGDGSMFDQVVHRAQYSGDNEDVEALPPITALSLQRGGLAVVVSASRTGIVHIQPLPASDGVEVVSDVHVFIPKAAKKKRGTASADNSPSKKDPRAKGAPAKKSGRKRAHFQLESEESLIDRVGDAPRVRHPRSRAARRPVARVHASSTVLPSGIQRIVVQGAVAPGTSTTLYVNMTKPAVATAGVLRQRLRARGVVIDGAVAERAPTSNASTLALVKRPLRDFASVVNKRSDNYLAEHIFKMCGAASGVRPSSAAASVQSIVRSLDSLGVPRMGCSFNDGSGLSRRNVVSASTQVALLQRIIKQPWADEYRSTLAVAGIDGTIRKRMIGTVAANNVQAKTGTLRNVSALTGYATTRDGELLAFSFISNGSSVSSFKYTEDVAATTLAAFSWNGFSTNNSVIMPTSPAETSQDKVTVEPHE